MGERELFNFRRRVYEVVEVIGKSPLIFRSVNNKILYEKQLFIKIVRCFMRLKSKE